MIPAAKYIYHFGSYFYGVFVRKPLPRRKIEKRPAKKQRAETAHDVEIEIMQIAKATGWEARAKRLIQKIKSAHPNASSEASMELLDLLGAMREESRLRKLKS